MSNKYQNSLLKRATISTKYSFSLNDIHEARSACIAGNKLIPFPKQEEEACIQIWATPLLTLPMRYLCVRVISDDQDLINSGH